jgi:hypothetical protein
LKLLDYEYYWNLDGLQEAKHEHGHEKREGNQKGKSDKRIAEDHGRSKARQEESLHCAQTQKIKLRKLLGNAENATRRGDNKLRLTRR